MSRGVWTPQVGVTEEQNKRINASVDLLDRKALARREERVTVSSWVRSLIEEALP